MTNTIKHCFYHLTFLVKCPLKYLPLLKLDFLKCWEFFTIFRHIFLSDIHLTESFPQFMACLFINSVFYRSLILMKFYLSICSFMHYTFDIITKKSLLKLSLQIFSFTFSFRGFRVFSFTLRSMIYFDFCVWCKVWTQVHYFCVCF